MKKAIRGAMVLAFVTLGLTMKAQSCSDYYPMKKGTTYELKRYDKKDKLESVKFYEIVASSGSSATIHTIVTNKDNEEIINAEYEMICEGDKVSIDMNKVLSETLTSSLAKSGSEASAEVRGTSLVIPNNLEVGQTLPDSDIDMDIEAGSINLNFSIKNLEKKVVAKESVTVPAGTFDCVVIEQHTETKMMITKKGTVKMWLAKGVGVVKQEDYDKKGNLNGYEVLTKFE